MVCSIPFASSQLLRKHAAVCSGPAPDVSTTSEGATAAKAAETAARRQDMTSTVGDNYHGASPHHSHAVPRRSARKRKLIRNTIPMISADDSGCEDELQTIVTKIESSADATQGDNDFECAAHAAPKRTRKRTHSSHSDGELPEFGPQGNSMTVRGLQLRSCTPHHGQEVAQDGEDRKQQQQKLFHHMMVTDEDVDQVCSEFFRWLAEPPITPFEVPIKQRRVTDSKRLKPIRSNLKFLFSILLANRCITKTALSEALAATEDATRIHAPMPNDVPASLRVTTAGAAAADDSLENKDQESKMKIPDARSPARMELPIFTSVATCKAVYQALLDHNAGAERVFQLFLLIRKVLVYLSSMHSVETKHFTPPTSFASYIYVDALCREATERRKRSARNRKFGILNHMQAVGPPAHSAAAPLPRATSVSSRAPLQRTRSQASATTAAAALYARVPPLNRDEHMTAAEPAAEPDALDQPVEPSTSMTLPEMKRLANGVSDYLTSCCMDSDHDRMDQDVPNWIGPVHEAGGCGRSQPTSPFESAKKYARYLVTLTLLLGLAPRSQVLKAMQLGTTFIKGGTAYSIRMPAEMSKSNKPTVIPLHARLTPLYDHYFAAVRPVLLRGLPDERDSRYVFLKEDGTGPRPEFSSWTRHVTSEVLNKSYNAHSFRHAVITSLYEAGSTQAEMDQLAILMQHDASVARDVYFRPQMWQAANQATSRLAALMMDE
jgi:integrase